MKIGLFFYNLKNGVLGLEVKKLVGKSRFLSIFSCIHFSVFVIKILIRDLLESSIGIIRLEFECIPPFSRLY